MIVLLAIACGVLFGAGAFLLLGRDLVRMAAGALLLGQSANLFLMASALTRGEAPVLPVESPGDVSDPLVQALTLTALVISFAIAALLLALVLRVHATHGTIEIAEVTRAAREAERAAERGGDEGEEETGRGAGEERG